jgi:hypothetical protein
LRGALKQVQDKLRDEAIFFLNCAINDLQYNSARQTLKNYRREFENLLYSSAFLWLLERQINKD